MKALAGLVTVCLIPGVGGVTLQALLYRFGDIDTILAASMEELTATPGVGPRTAAAIRAADVSQTAAELESWQQEGIDVLTTARPDYPALLRNLREAPPVLFCRGQIPAGDTRTVAIVGTRRSSPASHQLARQAAEELARRGWTIVSGLAWGVDLAAHEGALQQGLTIAILGSGLRVVLPPAKQRLADRIYQQGALLSELHPETAPGAAGLVARNRLISGMSRATIMIESGLQGGSMHTARFASQQGRPIYAVTNGSEGNDSLLADGARPLAVDFSDWESLHEALNAW